MRKVSGLLLIATVMFAGSAFAQSVGVQVGGEGVIGKDSVKAGSPFSLDIFMSNDTVQTGFTLGFKLSGKNGLKKVTPAWSTSMEDSAFNAASNISAYNGFQDASVWDFGKLMKSVRSWDGALPDSILVGGIAMNSRWEPCDMTHYISFNFKSADAGTLCIDSAFIPPSGAWLYSNGSGSTEPEWGGLYCVTVVK